MSRRHYALLHVNEVDTLLALLTERNTAASNELAAAIAERLDGALLRGGVAIQYRPPAAYHYVFYTTLNAMRGRDTMSSRVDLLKETREMNDGRFDHGR